MHTNLISVFNKLQRILKPRGLPRGWSRNMAIIQKQEGLTLTPIEDENFIFKGPAPDYILDELTTDPYTRLNIENLAEEYEIPLDFLEQILSIKERLDIWIWMRFCQYQPMSENFCLKYKDELFWIAILEENNKTELSDNFLKELYLFGTFEVRQNKEIIKEELQRRNIL